MKKKLKMELPKKMIIPYYFTVKTLVMALKITSDSHNISHSSSILIFTPSHINIGIDRTDVNNFLKEMATIYARITNQYKFKCHTLFSASFYKLNDGDQRVDETEIFNILNNIRILTESDTNNVDFDFHSKLQIQIQETKDSGWIFDKIISMKISFHKTGE